jgi:dienelactone hydrolase
MSDMHFRRLIPIAVAGAVMAAPAFSDDSSEALKRRKQYWEQLTKILPHTTAHGLTGRINGFDKTWEDWVKRTGELPPDFASMPSIPELPDPLLLQENGKTTPITTPEQWLRRRPWIRSQFERWVFGRMPPPPGNLRAVETARTQEGRVTVRQVRLEFGPDHKATLRLQLFIPEGKGPFPVFLTNQPRSHGWIYTAVRRGYLACFYYATDPKYGFPDDSDAWIDVYPEYDFSCLARWAWAGMRAVDYLYTLPEVDKARIGITGHSRNGKQALLAAAFDTRIGAVIPSSGNTGECLPWRYTPSSFATGTIEGITGGPHNTHWFHPRLRFFSGREHKLPVDQNMLLAMVAPRGLMMYTGFAEHEGNPFGFEQAYRSARSVYRLLGHEENIWLHLRAGEHGTTGADIENFMNFFDTVFGRRKYVRSETWTHGYTFEGWQKLSGEKLDPLAYPRRQPGDFVVDNPTQWDERKATIRQNIQWALGEEPPGLPFEPRARLSELGTTTDNWLALLLRRPLKGPNMDWAILPFGDGLKADLYYPSGGRAPSGKWPVVVWLHSHSYHTGYSRYAGPPFQSLTRRGFAVLAFDQLGFGTRVLDAKDFYKQYPKWSLMGKMVTDTRAAIAAVRALDVVDPARIYVVGYGLGAKVGLLVAALDHGVTALAAVCGFDPLRLDTPNKGTEGLRHYSHLHGLMPRLGFFIEHESRLPFDYDQVLAAAAPKPVLLVAPELDRYAPVEDVRREVDAARKIYRLLRREEALRLDTPLDFNRFKRQSQEQVFDWLAGVR